MTLVFIFWGSYEGFRDVLACAKARAGCPVWVISDQPGNVSNGFGSLYDGIHRMHLSAFPAACAMRVKLAEIVGAWASFSLARWFVLREFALLHPEIFPVFCADWDVMIFRNLAEAYRPFEIFDYTVSVDGGMESAAYGINHMLPLQSFCELVQKLIQDNDPAAKNLNDMEAWSRNRRAHDFCSVGNLFEIKDGSVFDHNMHCGADRFMMNGPAKKVLFEKGHPYFVQLDARLVLANTIHAWGSFKTKTEQVRKMAGIPL